MALFYSTRPVLASTGIFSCSRSHSRCAKARPTPEHWANSARAQTSKAASCPRRSWSASSSGPGFFNILATLWRATARRAAKASPRSITKPTVSGWKPGASKATRSKANASRSPGSTNRRARSSAPKSSPDLQTAQHEHAGDDPRAAGGRGDHRRPAHRLPRDQHLPSGTARARQRHGSKKIFRHAITKWSEITDNGDELSGEK